MSGKQRILYSFAGGDDGSYPTGLIYQSGMLYGTTYIGGSANLGTVFSVDPGTGAELVLHSFAKKHDGAEPIAAPFYLNGALFGTTQSGGRNDMGSLFTVNPTTGVESVIYSFGAAVPNALNPNSPLVYQHGKFYGTTYVGGTENHGTIQCRSCYRAWGGVLQLPRWRRWA